MCYVYKEIMPLNPSIMRDPLPRTSECRGGVGVGRGRGGCESSLSSQGAVGKVMRAGQPALAAQSPGPRFQGW